MQTVYRVNHPELEDCEKLWLIGVASYASETGKGAYPGYISLCEITGRGFDRQRIYSRKCEKLGLVELVSKGRGKGIANVYRICLEHPAYPEDYAGRKTASDEKGFSDIKTASDGKGFSSKTACVTDQNRLPNNSKPLADGTKTACVGKALSYTASEPTHTHTSKLPKFDAPDSPTADECVGVESSKTEDQKLIPKNFDLQSEVNAFLRNFVSANHGHAGTLTTAQDNQLKQLIKENGKEVFRKVARHWFKVGMFATTTTHPFGPFIAGFAGYLGMLQYAEAETQRKADTEAKREASVEVAKQQHEAVWGKPEDAEEAVEAQIEEISSQPDADTIFEDENNGV